MLVTLEWLKEYVEFDLDAEGTANLLTMAGLEVEGLAESEIGPVLSVTVTPNRGDCLSVVGLAREVMAKLADACRPTAAWAEYRAGWKFGDEEGSEQPVSVRIEDAELCPRYGARLVKGFRVGPSSCRMQQRLIACGMRPITNIVDVTNYVLLELGQPLHAFDHDRLSEGRIVVRQPRPGETITTLDGVPRAIAPPMLMICDAQRPVAVAGVMGGGESEVSESTTNLLLESAYFNPVSIRRTSKALGLRTEASYRFERSVDPDGIVTALNRACRLIEQETGIGPVHGVTDEYPNPQPAKQIVVDMGRANRLLGMDVPQGEAMGFLTRLGLKVEPRDGCLSVTVPPRRSDVTREEDLIEEIGRTYGYEHIPDELPMGRTLLGHESTRSRFERSVREQLVRMGLTEVVNHSLRAPSPLDDTNEYVGPRQPAGPELSVLRPSLAPGLAASALHNINRGTGDLALFEIGRVFRQGTEARHVAVLLCGRKNPPDWQVGEKGAPQDFYALDGLLKALLERMGVSASFVESADARFHPGRQVSVEGLGLFGELHPNLVETLDLPKRTLMAELSLDAMNERARKEYSYAPPPRFPSVRRDLAFEIPRSVKYERVESLAREAASVLCEEVRLFDVYAGKGIAEGSHSLALALTLRKPDGTLTDEEANEVRERVFSALETLGAKRR